MSRPATLRRSLAATAALVAASWGAAALPAQADDTTGQTSDQTQGTSQGHHGNGEGKGHDKGDQGNNGHHGDQGNGGDKGNGGDNGDKGPKGPKGPKGGHGDPAGNNGTVKIAPYGEMDGIPQNSPHPGCTFQVEWYGYDEGADIVSQVSFAMQAPTKDVGLTVDGPSSVFVGGDPASGAGTDTGLDGTETYTLSFDGEPHPQQGFHVKLTVATPKSKGNDTKTKVFWVAPCEDDTDTGDTGDTGGTTGDTGGTTGGTGDTGTETEGTGDDLEVLGVQASTGQQTSSDDTQVAGTQASQGVPTSVDAGESGPRTFADWMRSPLPLIGVAFGLALIAFAARRRLGSTRA